MNSIDPAPLRAIGHGPGVTEQTAPELSHFEQFVLRLQAQVATVPVKRDAEIARRWFDAFFHPDPHGKQRPPT